MIPVCRALMFGGVSEFWRIPPHDFNAMRFSLPLVNPNAAPLEVGNDAWHRVFLREEARLGIFVDMGV